MNADIREREKSIREREKRVNDITKCSFVDVGLRFRGHRILLEVEEDKRAPHCTDKFLAYMFGGWLEDVLERAYPGHHRILRRSP
jgi:hypothetical protein